MKKLLLIAIFMLAEISQAAVISEQINNVLSIGQYLNVRRAMNALNPNDFVKTVDVTASTYNQNGTLTLYADNNIIGVANLTGAPQTFRFLLNRRNGVDYTRLQFLANYSDIYVNYLSLDIEASYAQPPSSQYIEKTFTASMEYTGRCGKSNYSTKVQLDAVVNCQNARAKNCTTTNVTEYEFDESPPPSNDGYVCPLIACHIPITKCTVTGYATGLVLDRTVPHFNSGPSYPVTPINGQTGGNSSSNQIVNNSGQVVVVNGDSNQVVIGNTSSDHQNSPSRPTQWTCQFYTAYNPAPGYGSSEAAARGEARNNCINAQYATGGNLQYLCPVKDAVCTSN